MLGVTPTRDQVQPADQTAETDPVLIALNIESPAAFLWIEGKRGLRHV